nr:MAG TPA: hypothetical protein [Caudoviricetes sp.]
MEVLNVLIVPAIVKLFDMINKKEWGGIAKVFLAIAAGIRSYRTSNRKTVRHDQ